LLIDASFQFFRQMVFDACDYKLLDVGSGFGLMSHYRSYKADTCE